MVPIVPGGVGAGLKAARAADAGIDAVKAADKAADLARAADKAADAAKAAGGTPLVALLLDDRAQWYRAGTDLADFLARYRTATGDKFWE